MQLYEKYLKEAEELTEKGDLSQASEKYWGAVVEIIKMIAEKRGKPHKGHILIKQLVSELDEERPQLNIANDFSIAESLHINFYEGNTPLRIFKRNVERIKILIANLKKFL